MSSISHELKSEIVRAGAGAGKTTALVQKVLDLYLHFKSNHQRRPRLIVSTFTRKATQELRERLILEACKRQDGQFLSFVMDTSSLHISTLHGVFHLFLQSYGHLLGQESSVEILDDYDHHLWLKEKVRDQVFLKPEILETFKFFQWYEILKSGLEIISPLGSVEALNLADVLTATETYLRMEIEKLGSETENLMASCSSDKWKDYLSKVSKLLSEATLFESIDTFLQWRTEFLNLGRKPNFPKSGDFPMDPSDFESWNENFEDLKKTIKKEFLDPVFWPEQIDMQQKWLPLLNEDCQRVLELKKTFSKISVADIEGLVWHILEKAPELSLSFAQDWDYWLIDEFQDTSPMQVRLIEKLRGDRPQFLVGDPQQSIYQFRGAEPEIFGKEEARFKQTQQLSRTLLKNYRSAAPLLRFVNSMFVPMSPQFVSMEPAREQGSGEVADFFILQDHEDEIAIEKAIVQKVQELRNADVAWNEIAVLARTNNELRSIAATLDKFGIPTHLYSNFGFESKREILDSGYFLRFLCNPNDDEALLGLLRSPWMHVEDQDLIDLISDQKTARASSRALGKLSFWSQVSALSFANLNSSPALEFAIDRLKAYLNCYREFGAAECLSSFFRDSGIIDFSHFHDPTGRRESNLWKLLQELRNSESRPGHQLRSWLQRIGAHLGGAWISDTFQSGSAEAVASLEPNSVVLMTIHASKGLEFAHVLIPNVHKKPNTGRASTYRVSLWQSASGPKVSLPISFGEEEKPRTTVFEACLERACKAKEDAEFERLFYVATTRAKKTLSFFSYSQAEKGSWIQRLSLKGLEPVNEDKIYSGPEFSYRIRKLNPDVKFQKSNQNLPMEVLPLWSPITNRKAKRIGITEIVEGFLNLSTTSFVGRKGMGIGDSILRGIQFHKSMEKWIYWQQLNLNNESKNLEEDFFNEVGFKPAFEFLCALDRPPFLALLENGRPEFGFIANAFGHVLEGKIDFWSQDEEGNFWILDYKTGSIATEEKTFLQLELYAWALCKHLSRQDANLFDLSNSMSCPKIYLSAIYPFEEKCMVREFQFLKIDSQLREFLASYSKMIF